MSDLHLPHLIANVDAELDRCVESVVDDVLDGERPATQLDYFYARRFALLFVSRHGLPLMRRLLDAHAEQHRIAEDERGRLYGWEEVPE
ncbi:MAG: hypothetical protein AAF081_08585 [Actinomycetota bacterium]